MGARRPRLCARRGRGRRCARAGARGRAPRSSNCSDGDATRGRPAREAVSIVLQSAFADKYTVLPPGEPGPWTLESDGALGLITIFRTEPVHVRIKAGVGLSVPLTDELVMYVAKANRDLWNGQAYLVAGDGGALVILEELLWATALYPEFRPSLQDLANRIGTLMVTAGRMSKEVVERFGGTFYADLDWIILVN